MFGKFLFLGADVRSCYCWVGVLCALVSVVLFSSYESLVVLFCLVGNFSGILISVTIGSSLYVFLVTWSSQKWRWAWKGGLTGPTGGGMRESTVFH